MLLQHILFNVILLLAPSFGDEQPLVTTPLGAVLGHYKDSYGGRIFSAFEGIPYAKPPIGDLRFAEPQAIEPWTGTVNATTVHVCVQLSWETAQVVGDEDCLYLNIYVPKNHLKPDENMDVIMHIHGGAFTAGSPDLGGPEYLMDRNIVYITINYRLGPLGFLSTEDDVVPGNNGLKDQVLALKWIQNNIQPFGGNPEAVTILGMSAGGASVQFHYLSPLSRGLFHRGIAQSGSALAPYATQKTPLEKARKLAAFVGCNESSTKEFVKCMRQRSAKQLYENLNKFYTVPGFPIALFSPVVEKASENAFLSDYPHKLLESGNVNDIPLMTTVTTEEGILGVLCLNNNFDNLNEDWNEVLPHVLDYNHTVKESDKDAVAQKIKQFYFGDEDITKANVQSFIKLFGDRYFTLDFERFSRMQAKVAKSPVFSYLYGYRGDHNYLSLFGLDKSYGVGHGEDGNLLYVEKYDSLTLKQDKLSESDTKIKELLLDLVTSFAKNGNPDATNVNWESVSTTDSDDFGYLFIHKPGDVKMVFKKELAPTEFWRSLPIMEHEKTVTATV